MVGDNRLDDVEIPPKVYKYYPPGGIEKVLSSNTLRWALPCEENDPFEALARCWDVEAVRENAKGLRPEDWMFLEGIFEEKEVQKLVSHVAAFVSFSKCNNSVLMWAHYAANHTGACVEFDPHQVQRFNCLRPVKYAGSGEEREEYPLPHGSLKEDSAEYQERASNFLCKKGAEWAYEHELRLILPPLVKYIGCCKVDENFILVSEIPRGAITRLIFGYNVPVSTRVAWAKRVLMNHPNCEFAQVVPDRKKYELIPQELNMNLIENSAD